MARTDAMMARMHRLIPIIGIILALAVTAPAQAGTFPGERPANNATLNELVAIGETFWHERGVQPCPQDRLEVLLADDLDGAGGMAIPGGCRVWFPVVDVAFVQSHPASGRASASALCWVVVHELGHTAGLGHSESGVMSADGQGSAPWACRVWARGRRAAALHSRVTQRGS
jgi:hypothetical protein